MRGLLLSAYDAGSHRRWRKGVAAHVPMDWTVRTLPPRHFLWRVRGNPLWFALGDDPVPDDVDVVLATSSTDLSTLRGLRPGLARALTVAYFHENQLAYPDRRRSGVDANLALLDAYTALAADRVLFNSPHNRDTLLEGLDALFRRLPDAVPKGLAARIADKSAILPVPLEPDVFQTPLPRTGPLHVLWNHRWEHDKGPDVFVDALERLSGRVDFRLHVVGQQFRTVPDAFGRARETLAAHIDTWGFVEDVAAYRRLLRSCDVVVSTAQHEFQGLSVLEAWASGCRPVVPDRLAYRDYVPEAWRYPTGGDEAAVVADTLAALDVDVLRREVPEQPTSLSWSALEGAWRDALTP